VSYSDVLLQLEGGKTVRAIFGKHQSQLSEIFWEGLEHFVKHRGKLITGDISSALIDIRASEYANAVFEKVGALPNCVGFIDGTVIGISRPGDLEEQRVLYNGHKRKHALKFQAVTSPDGLILHAHGPMEGRRHDWTLFLQSGLDNQLAEKLRIGGTQYCLYKDSGYSQREYLEIPYQGSALSAHQRAFNKQMPAARITVE
jgi:nuclease HARBI1